METIQITEQEKQDREFIRTVYRNRNNLASILECVALFGHGLTTDPEQRMAAIEDEWLRADKRKKASEG